MCLMDGLIIQAVLAEFENVPDRRSIWDKHAERVALTLRAQRRKSSADTVAQVAERLVRRILFGAGRVFRRDRLSDRSRRR
jgi:hypothetical protein